VYQVHWVHHYIIIYDIGYVTILFGFYEVYIMREKYNILYNYYKRLRREVVDLIHKYYMYNNV